MARLGEQLGAAAARPGLVLIATADPYVGGEQRARWAAERASAQVALLPGQGHWWMLEDPRPGAEALRSFWEALDDQGG
jgi:pimeloyl-ACP methyl ester carboxylesterase